MPNDRQPVQVEYATPSPPSPPARRPMGYRGQGCLTLGCLVLSTLAVVVLIALYALLDHISNAWNFKG